MSLEEPAEARGIGGDSSAPPEQSTPPKPRTMATFMVLWLSLALFWLVGTLWFFSQGHRDYFYLRLAIGLGWLSLAVFYFVQWRRAKARLRNQP